ncbi:hypothetical protein H9P43_003378 [Blastocladiella emersonii ATCC 22665]|nr:hypothetical protein H9P43_003378 [Blastocladiella emersonii ATCC 22665]
MRVVSLLALLAAQLALAATVSGVSVKLGEWTTVQTNKNTGQSPSIKAGELLFTDVQCPGETYELFQNDIAAGTTSWVPTPSSSCAAQDNLIKPEEAHKSGIHSTTTIPLDAGKYSFKFKVAGTKREVSAAVLVQYKAPYKDTIIYPSSPAFISSWNGETYKNDDIVMYNSGAVTRTDGLAHYVLCDTTVPPPAPVPVTPPAPAGSTVASDRQFEIRDPPGLASLHANVCRQVGKVPAVIMNAEWNDVTKLVYKGVGASLRVWIGGYEAPVKDSYVVLETGSAAPGDAVVVPDYAIEANLNISFLCKGTGAMAGSVVRRSKL